MWVPTAYRASKTCNDMFKHTEQVTHNNRWPITPSNLLIPFHYYTASAPLGQPTGRVAKWHATTTGHPTGCQITHPSESCETAACTPAALAATQPAIGAALYTSHKGCAWPPTTTKAAALHHQPNKATFTSSQPLPDAPIAALQRQPPTPPAAYTTALQWELPLSANQFKRGAAMAAPAAQRRCNGSTSSRTLAASFFSRPRRMGAARFRQSRTWCRVTAGWPPGRPAPARGLPGPVGPAASA